MDATEDSTNMDSDLMIIKPLGAGQEVGRSCVYMQFKGKKILLDFGIHPGLNGMDALPFVDFIDVDQIDLLLISHFHLDHCGALPWFLTKTTFKGRCFMTQATKAIYRWLLADYIKVSNNSTEHLLYNEQDLKASMEAIEVVSFHEIKEVAGIKFWCYHAGHVLGAAMFMIEIAGVRVLYTGDFSREEDRHLMSAEVPRIKPDVLITEATYGTHLHDNRQERESRFTNTIFSTVTQGGRCLIPVFALGRAQELLLILDEFWQKHPELQDIPIYYASSLAEKCMSVYQTHVSSMNDKIKRQITVKNPFVFKHILDLKSIDNFDDCGPCVVLASPGMMQSGLSRELFEQWCENPKNTCLIAGYCCEGTLAKHVLSEPDEILSMDGQKLNRKCRVVYISFSAHADYRQTSEFVRALHPPQIILVHGEANEMAKLKQGLTDQYRDDLKNPIAIHNPKNTQAVELHFRGEKTAKVIGTLAMEPPAEDKKLGGVLVKRNFNYHLMAPGDVRKYTDLAMSNISQTLTVSFQQPLETIQKVLSKQGIEFEALELRVSAESKMKRLALKIAGKILLTLDPDHKVARLEWSAGPNEDVYVDMLVALLTKHSIPASQQAKEGQVVDKGDEEDDGQESEEADAKPGEATVSSS